VQWHPVSVGQNRGSQKTEKNENGGNLEILLKQREYAICIIGLLDGCP